MHTCPVVFSKFEFPSVSPLSISILLQLRKRTTGINNACCTWWDAVLSLQFLSHNRSHQSADFRRLPELWGTAKSRSRDRSHAKNASSLMEQSSNKNKKGGISLASPLTGNWNRSCRPNGHFFRVNWSWNLMYLYRAVQTIFFTVILSFDFELVEPQQLTPFISKSYGTVGMHSGEIWSSVGQNVKPEYGGTCGWFDGCKSSWKGGVAAFLHTTVQLNGVVISQWAVRFLDLTNFRS